MGSRQRRLKAAVHAAVAERTRLRSMLAMYGAVSADMKARGLSSDDIIVAVDRVLIDIEEARGNLLTAIADADAGKVDVNYHHRREASRDDFFVDDPAAEQVTNG